jgi:hypothetical protein
VESRSGSKRGRLRSGVVAPSLYPHAPRARRAAAQAARRMSPEHQSRARFAVEEESRVAIARAQTPRRADRMQRRGPRRVMDWFWRASSLR